MNPVVIFNAEGDAVRVDAVGGGGATLAVKIGPNVIRVELEKHQARGVAAALELATLEK